MRTNLIVIGGSAGSLQVIMEVLPNLITPLNAAVVLVVHRKAAPGYERLTELLNTKSSHPVKEAEDKERIENGIIYIAPADYHLLIENDLSFSLDISEKVNFSRPSIDLTFLTAADVYQNNLVGILLSGANADGVSGLEYIKSKGGYCVAQDPATSQVPYMPLQAIARKTVDLIAGPDEITQFINKVGRP